MNGKISKEIRKFLKVKYPHLYSADNKIPNDKLQKLHRELYQELKKQYKNTPKNLRNVEKL